MPETIRRIERAFLSVSDKTGLPRFASFLATAGVELISTGGTAFTLRKAGVKVIDVSDFTGFQEILDGRVKTLHPKVHGALLYLRGNCAHEETIAANDIRSIDLLVVNLYPFVQTVARQGVTLPEAIENIDIGGPAMLRSGAKNHEFVTVVTDPADYTEVTQNFIENNGGTTLQLRRRLALKVFKTTSTYDNAIANYLEGVGFGG